MAIIPSLQARGKQSDDVVTRLNKLKASMSSTRKVLRFGKEIPLVTRIADRHKVGNKESIKTLRSVSDLFLALYFLTDHPLFFHNTGFWKFEQTTLSKIDYINNVFWLLNALLDIFISLYEVSRL